MMTIEFVVARGCFAMMALAAAGAVVAQPGGRANPADASIPVPAVKPGSAFSGYQSFREQPIKSWKDANQEVADNPGMGSMKGMSGMAGHNMPGMDSKGTAAGHDMNSMPGMGAKAGAAPKPQAGMAAGHDMSSMKGMPGMGAKAGGETKPHAADGHAHNAGSMQAMPGMTSKSGSTPKTPAGSQPGHDMASMQTMPGMASKSGNTPSGPVTGTGVVRGVDKANGKVKLTHDPILATGWPKMTLFFRLKDNALADRVKEGDSVEFSLEKSASGYVISDLQKRSAVRATKPAK